jgi:hypothetical protein
VHNYQPAEREYNQQHRGLQEGTQSFALLELAKWEVKYVRRLFGKRYTEIEREAHALKDKGAYLMVLESVGEAGGTGTWRRVGLVDVERSEVVEEGKGWSGTEAAWRWLVETGCERRVVTII